VRTRLRVCTLGTLARERGPDGCPLKFHGCFAPLPKVQRAGDPHDPLCLHAGRDSEREARRATLTGSVHSGDSDPLWLPGGPLGRDRAKWLDRTLLSGGLGRVTPGMPRGTRVASELIRDGGKSSLWWSQASQLKDVGRWTGLDFCLTSTAISAGTYVDNGSQ